MTSGIQPEHFGVHNTAAGLHLSLQQYIEAQYHIRDDSLVSERKALMQEPGVIAQEAYVEATPVYALGKPYAELEIPEVARDALTRISAMHANAGLYPRPYKHQEDALVAFLGSRASDLVVATGTGSGKTESFLMPIIGQLAVESQACPSSNDMPGCRALLLYPMNALVNDQVGRIRRLLGNPEVNTVVGAGRGRPITFGSYTGRTPYPGKRSAAKDAANIAPLFDEFYSKVETQPDLLEQLRSRGRWPSKNMAAFYNPAAVQEKTWKSGKKVGKQYVAANWAARLRTQPEDRELMTRHEMQEACPDVLVTNYSMLEYMLLRPIERSIFDQTAAWLAADVRNELILVLDEAHMYRGAGGAEVALLLRRLIARLGITRDRVRCILTSASLGEGPTALEDVEQFAKDLTGHVPSSKRSFEVVIGTKEKRADGRPGDSHEVEALANCGVNALANIATEPAAAANELETLANALGWKWNVAEQTDLLDLLFSSLSGFGPAELLISTVMGRATQLKSLQTRVFPNASDNEGRRALDALLALCSIAKRRSDQRILMPTRLHLFHRGLPGLYACTDPQCSTRMHSHSSSSLVGRFHTKSLSKCSCKSEARVFEFLTHRDCGAAFLRGWVDDQVDFLWHEPDAVSVDDNRRELYPVDILVEEKANPAATTRDMWLHISTGRLRSSEPHPATGFRKIQVPDKNVKVTKEMRFDNCPVCLKKTMHGDGSKIMDHVTKGEAPFSSLVRAQINYQPATRKATKTFPNAGRKVLVFSDGRQKAARLARDMPRDMELDVFRQAVALGSKALEAIPRESRPTNAVLYLAFLATLGEHNLSMFDIDASTVDSHVDAFKKQEIRLEEALEDNYEPGTPPHRYKTALLKLLCSNYYSLSGTTVGFAEPSKVSTRKINAALSGLVGPSDVRALAYVWIDELLSGFAFDADLSNAARGKAAGFYKDNWGSKGKLPKSFRGALISKFGFAVENIEKIEQQFCSVLATQKDGYFLVPNALKLTIDLEHHWFQCSECTALSPLTFRDCCIACGSSAVRELDPSTDPYLVARKSFWRAPVATALEGRTQLTNLYAEEHTAQLSNRDRKSVHSTTEEHELRFQDLLLNETDRPIDVLSCTTTMEVGIDIGSLVAVALRNVPPQRENYQQRAGRAGRRGSSVSTVVTYSQNGPHDSYYFLNPEAIVSGPPRSPELKIDNPKIAKRHVASYLVQTYFQTHENAPAAGAGSAILQRALGKTREFFHSESESGLNLISFSAWVNSKILQNPCSLRAQIAGWLPRNLDVSVPLSDWVVETTEELLHRLRTLKEQVPMPMASVASGDIEEEEDEASEKLTTIFEQEELLDFLFFHSLLPTYAFPTSLCGFMVEKWVQSLKGHFEIRLEQMPQQSTNQALSEYAPGRLVVINKQTYRSGGVFASTVPTEIDRATPLFDEMKRLVMCDTCSFVKDPHHKSEELHGCPVCGSELRIERVIQPEMFGPEAAVALSEDDREQEITYATMAQFPQPIGGESFEFVDVGPHLKITFAMENRLLTMNKGKTRDGQALGFSVCKKCGCSSVNDDETIRSGKHKRPYFARGRNVPECDGLFEKVFLWFDFPTDLLLLRLSIAPPLITDLTRLSTVKTLESAAHSIAEALRLAASRHRQLDLDPTEFGAGFRLLPAQQDGSISLDIYLYDTLAGGAGYSQLAGKYFNEIIRSTLEVLEGCDCDTSCTDCLDHFHNQQLKKKLDRSLGSSLLRYSLYGTVPTAESVTCQMSRLAGLASSLSLDGYEYDMPGKVDGQDVPMVVRKNSKVVGVEIYPALSNYGEDIRPANSLFYVNEAALRSDLVGVHSKVRKLLI
jgi:ATP-dependent helicase YprA (DUF1998 family)